jgi:hypothetical protein
MPVFPRQLPRGGLVPFEVSSLLLKEWPVAFVPGLWVLWIRPTLPPPGARCTAVRCSTWCVAALSVGAAGFKGISAPPINRCYIYRQFLAFGVTGTFPFRQLLVPGAQIAARLTGDFACGGREARRGGGTAGPREPSSRQFLDTQTHVCLRDVAPMAPYTGCWLRCCGRR